MTLVASEEDYLKSPSRDIDFRQAKGGVWNGGGWIRQISGPEFWNFRA